MLFEQIQVKRQRHDSHLTVVIFRAARYDWGTRKEESKHKNRWLVAEARQAAHRCASGQRFYGPTKTSVHSLMSEVAPVCLSKSSVSFTSSSEFCRANHRIPIGHGRDCELGLHRWPSFTSFFVPHHSIRSFSHNRYQSSVTPSLLTIRLVFIVSSVRNKRESLLGYEGWDDAEFNQTFSSISIHREQVFRRACYRSGVYLLLIYTKHWSRQGWHWCDSSCSVTLHVCFIRR